MWRMVIVAAFALLQAVFSGGAAVATREIFKTLGGDAGTLGHFPLLFIAISGIAIALLRWNERLVAENLGQEFASELRIGLFKHIAQLPSTERVKRRIGGLSLRFVGDLTAIRSWVSRGITRLLSAAIVMPVIGLVLYYINSELAIAALIPVILGLVIMVVTGSSLLKSHRRLRQRRSKLASNVTERLPHAAELRLLGRLGRELKQIERRTITMIEAVLERQRRTSLIRVIPDCIGGLATALMLFVALSEGVSSAETAGALAALAMLVQKMRELGTVWDRYCAWDAARKRCLSLLDVPPLAAQQVTGKYAKGKGQGVQICLENVSGPGFKKISAIAKPGEKIGIIGPNGSGKSWLLQLIGGMEHPLNGRVELDQIPAVSWVNQGNKRLTYLGAESPILSGSMRRALTMGMRRRPKDDEIKKIANSYGLADVLDRLGGLDGHIAESGRNLSAGEIRRILLTRAAMTRANLILLDDPDKNMDSNGKALIRQLLQNTNATVLMVSHDQVQLNLMDRIWNLENGNLGVLNRKSLCTH